MRLRETVLWAAVALLTTSACSEEAEPLADASQVNASQPPQNGTAASPSNQPGADASTPQASSGDASVQDAGSLTAMDTSIVRPADDAAMVGADSALADAARSDANTEGGSGDGSAPPAGRSCLQGTGDFTKAGPYKFKQKDVTIGNKGSFTIVYPDPLEAACPHPIVAWGNGTFITGGTAYAPFNEHAASWGIVSIASHNSNVGDGSFHRAALDYLLAQHKQSGSEFFGKLSEKAGVSGHSQGGAGADRAASHPNVKAIANVQGSFGTPPQSPAAFLCLTGTEDIQPTGCPMAVKAAKVPALSASYQGADHVSTTLGEGTGIDQYKRLYSAWFRCFLADDAQACAMFKGGADCPVCKERGWAEIFANNY